MHFLALDKFFGLRETIANASAIFIVHFICGLKIGKCFFL